MPLFTFTCLDKPASLDLRMATREGHLAFIRDLGDRVKLGGPFLDDAGRMIGSLIVVEAEDMASAEALSAADPYVTSGLFESVEIRQFKVTVGQL